MKRDKRDKSTSIARSSKKLSHFPIRWIGSDLSLLSLSAMLSEAAAIAQLVDETAAGLKNWQVAVDFCCPTPMLCL